MKLRRPRWLRLAFSLRTLFLLVALLCGWLGYQMNWMRQREAYVRECSRELVEHDFDDQGGRFIPAPSPWPIRWFGASGRAYFRIWVNGVDQFNLTLDDKQRIAHAKDLFPEASIIIHGHNPNVDRQWIFSPEDWMWKPREVLKRETSPYRFPDSSD